MLYFPDARCSFCEWKLQVGELLQYKRQELLLPEVGASVMLHVELFISERSQMNVTLSREHHAWTVIENLKMYSN